MLNLYFELGFFVPILHLEQEIKFAYAQILDAATKIWRLHHQKYGVPSMLGGGGGGGGPDSRRLLPIFPALVPPGTDKNTVRIWINFHPWFGMPASILHTFRKTKSNIKSFVLKYNFLKIEYECPPVMSQFRVCFDSWHKTLLSLIII